MKVRIYSPFLPYPVNEGAFQVIHDQVRSFLDEGHEVELVVWKSPVAGAVKSPVLSRARVTSFFEASGSPRDRRALRFLRSLSSPFASPELFYYPPEIDLRGGLPDADLGIYHYSFAYAWLRAGSARESRRVVHLHNLESDLFEERAAKHPLQKLNSRKLRLHESALLETANELWFVSPADLKRFEGLNPGSEQKLVLRPPTFDPVLMAARRSRRAPVRPLVAGFVGGLEFHPNQASVEWILREVCPLLAREGFAGSLEIVGRGAPEWLVALARPYPFVKFLGFVPDLEEWWARIGVLLVPHITGSGVRIKLLEALVGGVPVLANPEAISGISEQTRQSPLLSNVPLQDRLWASKLTTSSS